ncbi:MAG: hypothetical protein RR670_06425 [Erysipelotrichaceae bacterium]
MIGYVDEAKQSEYIAQARTAYVAAQTVAIKEEAKDSAFDVATIKFEDATNPGLGIKKYLGTNTKVTAISGIEGTKEAVTKITVTVGKYTVTFAEGQEPKVVAIP